MNPDNLDCFEIVIVPEARTGKSLGKYAGYAQVMVKAVQRL